MAKIKMYWQLSRKPFTECKPSGSEIFHVHLSQIVTQQFYVSVNAKCMLGKET